MRALLRIALGLLAAVGGLALLAFLAQRRLLYFPERQDPAAAERAAAGLGLAPLRDAAGEILGWSAPHPSLQPEAIAIVLHGNAGQALHRTYLVDVLRTPDGPPLEIVLLEYPGYGPRAGRPSETSLVRSAVEAVDALAARGLPVILVGESIGSGVAALAAAERPAALAGLLLVTPLASVPAVARRHYPGLPSFLLRDRFESGPALARFGGPAVFLVAGADEIVFADLGRALFESYPGRKRLILQERASHNGIRYDARDPAWTDAIRFLLAR